MAFTVVNLTDSFDEWLVNTNTLGTNTGDLTTLSTTAKGTLVAAINEIFTSDSDDLENIVEDTSPQLGGSLDVNGQSIVSLSNASITITPHGTGDVNLETDKVKIGSSGEDVTVTTNGSGSLTIGPNNATLSTTPVITLENAGRILLNCVSGQAVVVDGDVQATNVTAGEEMTAVTFIGALTGNVTGNVLGSGTIAGTITGTTQSASNNTTLIATTAYVDAQVATENTIAEMNDVTITSLANDNILQYNSGTSRWVNTVSVAGVSEDDATALAIALGG